MPARKKSMNVNGGIQGVHPFSKIVKKRALSKHRERPSEAICATQSPVVGITPIQSVDLVQCEKRRRAVAFDPSYVSDRLLGIFDKATSEHKYQEHNNLTNFDLVSNVINAGDTQNDSIKCQEIRFSGQYLLLRYNVDFETVHTWKQTSGNLNICFHNASFNIKVIGIVSGSTWLVTLTSIPLASTIKSGNLIDTHRTVIAKLMGIQIGVQIGTFIKSAFSFAELTVETLTDISKGIATGFKGSYHER